MGSAISVVREDEDEWRGDCINFVNRVRGVPSKTFSGLAQGYNCI